MKGSGFVSNPALETPLNSIRRRNHPISFAFDALLSHNLVNRRRRPIAERVSMGHYIKCACGERVDTSDSPSINGVFCPACGTTLEPAKPPSLETTPSLTEAPARVPAEEPLTVVPADAQTQKEVDEEFKRYILARRAAETQRTSSNAGIFGPGGIRSGMLGGVAMMALAAVWLVVGLMLEHIFIYPVILFIVGLVAFIRGIITGNIVGEKHPG
jgi:hypothetical protein